MKFPILIQIEKLLSTVVTRHVSASPGRNEYFFTLFHTRVELYIQRYAVYFAKMFRGKSMFCMQLQDYIKAMMLDFINKRSKAFIDFKWFKIVLLAAINSIIFIASLFIKLVYSAATKYLWLKKTARHSLKRCHNFEEYCSWNGQPNTDDLCKSH